MGREILLTPDGRKKVIDDIKSSENKNRRSRSLRQFEVYRGNLYPYVHEYLSRQFSINTLKEIPIVASINIAQRVVDQEASIYNREPERSWSEVDEKQEEALNTIYEDSKANVKLQYANSMYKLQDQTTLMVIPKEGKLHIRCLKNHQVDVIPNSENPEKADAYIVSVFNKADSDFVFGQGGQSNHGFTQADRINQVIGDQDDYEAQLERFLIWTEFEHFMMDGNGNIIGEVFPNPIGMLPFIDVAAEKDFEFWVKVASSAVDFCIEYNAALSMQNQVIKMQGFSQAWLKADASVMPEMLQIGPNYVLKLVKGKTVDGESIDTEFGYSSPSPDLTGTKEHLEMLLANFLSARGLNTGTVSSSKDKQTYSSGLERLLAMVEQFEASQNDFAIFRYVEEKLYEIIKRWHNVALTSNILLPKYLSSTIPDDSQVSVTFQGPEMIKGEKDIIELQMLKEELGVASRIDSIMAIYGLNRDEAQEKLAKIEEDNNAGQTQQVSEPNAGQEQGRVGAGPIGTETNEEAEA
jgi:hypothetical protein